MLGQLFLTFLRIGVFTFGGGYAMLPLIQREVVDKQEWLDAGQFLTAVAVAQSLPGVIAVNIALGVGWRLAGLAGALAAAAGAVLPSFLIILLVAVFLPQFRTLQAVESFFRGAQPAVLALLLYALWTVGRQALGRWQDGLLALAGAAAILGLGLHPALIILLAALLGAWRGGRAARQQAGKGEG